MPCLDFVWNSILPLRARTHTHTHTHTQRHLFTCVFLRAVNLYSSICEYTDPEQLDHLNQSDQWMSLNTHGVLPITQSD